MALLRAASHSNFGLLRMQVANSSPILRSAIARASASVGFAAGVEVLGDCSAAGACVGAAAVAAVVSAGTGVATGAGMLAAAATAVTSPRGSSLTSGRGSGAGA
jgi:hypothetical protein